MPSLASSTKGPSILAGSQQNSTGAVAERLEARSRSALVFVPKGAKRTLVILSLALAGCRGPINPTPTTDAVALRFLADSATSPLLHDLANSYRPGGLRLTWDIETAETYTVLDWLKAGEAPYALLDYLPGGFGSFGNAAGASGDSLWTTPVGQDGIAIVVNPANPVANLSASQLRMLFQGNVANWQEIGGLSQAVTVVAYPERSSQSAVMQAVVLGDRRMTQSALLALTSQAVIDKVSTSAGAVGYVSVGYVNGRVRAVPLDGVLPTPESMTAQRYPLSTPILFAGLHEPGDDAYRAFFAWVQSPDGQAIVRQHYGGLSTR